ncbi:MAG: ATP-binding cassette domain-containing protein [Pseudomonadota bacterium]|nr:ATP-binding cassette domain-containing protein [Pseudomonadota bacterium]
MPNAILEKASLAFGHYPLLDKVGLVLEPGEKVGLIGRNGAGKSSLIKVLSGVQVLDDGQFWLAPGLRVAVVEQEPEFLPDQSVFEAVAEGFGNLRSLLLEYHDITDTLASPSVEAGTLLERLNDLQQALEMNGGWSIHTRIEMTLSRLRLEANRKIGSLSGGWRKRVALARAIAIEPDFLMLDEPTNHLDVESIEWLEDMLANFRGTVLFVTHDRKFLDRVSNRILELDRGRLLSFPGNFSSYKQRKDELLEIEIIQQAKSDRFLAEEEAWIRQGIKARRTRNEGRVRRLETLRCERAARRERMGSVNFALEAAPLSGKMVAELEHVNFSCGGKVIARDFSCRIVRGDKIGFIGPNGIGKTSLIRLILGDMLPDEGKVRLGTHLDIAYFDQLREGLDPEATLIETISQGSDFIEINGERKHVISYLSDFLFSPARARSPVKSLSGGERSRLFLARLFSRPSNLIVLDEPTNDLDIETLELLEVLLLNYSGTIFLVSHDRAFLDAVVTQTLVAEGDGRWREYAGGYEDYLRVRSIQPKPDKAGQARSQVTKPSERLTRQQGLTWKERQELEKLPDEIERLEKEQITLTSDLAKGINWTAQEADRAKSVSMRLEAIEKELLVLLERWETLEAKKAG